MAGRPDPIAQPGADFWAYLDELVAGSRLVIDRPAGSAHPRYPGMIYPLDYGYLDGTRAMDGGGLDVWAGSLQPRALDAVIMTVDLHKGDAEIKLLLGCSEAEKGAVRAFLNSGAMRATLIRRETAELAFLRSRRSVRRFRPDPVPADLIRGVLQAATWAPSSHNRQPWRFAVLESRDARQRLAGRMGAGFRRDLLADGLPPEAVEAQVTRSRDRILEAPAAILVCMDPSEGDAYPDPRRQEAERLMGVQSAAMAGQNLLLAAHAFGLGGVWMCAPLFAPETVRQALGLPAAWQPQGLVLLGYPAKEPAMRPRRELGEVSIFL